jgi:alanine racemase
LAVAIKSNAYGHGIELMAKLAIENGVDVLAVNSLEEALLLKKFSPTPIMIMGEVPNLEERLTDLNHSNFWIVASRLKEIYIFQNSLTSQKFISRQTLVWQGLDNQEKNYSNF